MPSKKLFYTVVVLTIMLASLIGTASSATSEKQASVAGAFADPAADSVADYPSKLNSNGWSYGSSIVSGGHVPADCHVSRFSPFRILTAGLWHAPDEHLLWIGRLDQSSSYGSFSADRRWTAPSAGSVRLVGSLRKLDGTETTCVVCVNKVGRWMFHIAKNDSIIHGFDILLYDVPAKAQIDFVNSGHSSVMWAAQILSEPCTQFKSDLPIGPQFSNFEKQTQRSAGIRIIASLAEAGRSGKRTFVIPAGNYRFTGDPSSAPKLQNLSGLMIDARGATFWFEMPLVNGLEFDNCHNVKLVGLTIDCNPLPFFQGQIKDIDSESRVVSADLAPGYEPLEFGGQRTVSYYRPDGSYIPNGIIGCSWRRIPGTTTVEVDAPSPGVKVGDYLACAIRTGQQLRSIGCSGMAFRDISIYSGGGMAVYEAGGGGGSTYTNVRCTRRPGTSRLHAFGADGFHFSGLGKGPVLDRCEAAYLADDEVNVHGQFGSFVKQVSPNRDVLNCAYGRYFAGQRLDFWSYSELDPLGTAKVLGAIPAPGVGNWDVTLDRDMTLPNDALIDTHQQTSGGYVIKDCWFHDTGQRFLINGAPDGLITNNTLENIGNGVAIQNESWSNYTEGAFPSGTQFIGNRLINTASGILVTLNPGGRSGRGLRRSMPIHNVTLANNYIQSSQPVIDIDQVDGVRVTGNDLYSSSDSVEAGEYSPIDSCYGDPIFSGIRLAGVNNAQLNGNWLYQDGSLRKGSLVTIGPLTSNVEIDGARQWSAIADTLSCWYPVEQGGRAWSYDSLDVADINNGQYQITDASQLPLFSNDIWQRAIGLGQTPSIGRTAESASSLEAAVRRWTSMYSGTAKVDLTVVSLQAEAGTNIGIFLDGKQVWSHRINGGTTLHVSVPVNLRLGSALDLIVWSQDNKSANVSLYAKVQIPPDNVVSEASR